MQQHYAGMLSSSLPETGLAGRPIGRSRSRGEGGRVYALDLGGTTLAHLCTWERDFVAAVTKCC